MRPTQRLIGPVLVMATLVASIVSSFGAPLIPSIARELAVPLSSAQWSLTVALLAGAVSSPVLGRLGDGRHRRITMIGALFVVTSGGVLAALADSLGVLLVGRALQGVGLALGPLAMATAREALPRERATPMIALLSVSAGAGLGAGYPLSGLLAGAWGISGAYWFGAAVSVLTLLSVALVVPAASGQIPRRAFDVVGFALLGCALSAALIAVAEGAAWGWASPAIIGLLAAAILLGAAWTAHELRTPHPLVQLRLLAHPPVLVGDACALVLGVAMYMAISGMTEFVQSPRDDGFGFSAPPVIAGLVLIPLSLVMLLSSRALPHLARGLGTRSVLGAGCLVAACGCAFFALAHGALWEAFVMSAVLGAGLGVTFAAIPGVIVEAIPTDEVGSAMGFYQVIRFTGFSWGSALTATVLATSAGAGGAPREAGFTTVQWIAAGVCALAAIVAWASPRGHERVPAAQRVSAEDTRLLEETDGDELGV